MRHRITHVLFVAVTITLFSPEAAISRAIMPTLEMLTRSATLVVVAQVENVTAKGNVRIATARVIDVWKGQSAGIVQFRASRSWTCDVSNAIPGETVVLFLVENAQTGETAIAYSGMGRLPVNKAENKETVVLSGNLFTKGLKQEAGILQAIFNGEVNLAIFKRHVQQITQAPVKMRRA